MPFKIFQGVYEKFSDVPGSLDIFESDDYLKKTEQHLFDALAEKIEPREYLLTSIVSTLMLERGLLSVLDFGGGPGIIFLAIRNALSDLTGLTFHVLENESICRMANHIDSESLIFYSNVQKLLPHYDLVHLGSVIQYVEDLEGMLKMISDKSPKYILVSDAMVGTECTFVTTADWYGHKHPHRFMSFKDIIGLFRNFEYELAVKVPHISIIRGHRQFYDMSNMPVDCRVDKTWHLLFKFNK
jgi:putative methyltransferase (TIGR04325 family)